MMRSPTLLALARLVLASPVLSTLRMHTTARKTHTHPELWSPEFWEKIGVSCILVLLGGVFAGCVALCAPRAHSPPAQTHTGVDGPRRAAPALLKLMHKGRHWVLVVLLLGNVIVNESLPIFLDSAIGGGLAAVAISTTAIGAIIPQALSVRYGLGIGAACAPFVQGLMYVFAPVAYPIAKLLDFTLGKGESHTYKKAELRCFLQFHRTGEEPLRDEEISILNGVLDLGGKRVETIMTPMKDVVTLSADAVLDEKLVETILLSGYSRFPVHEPNDPEAFVGLLLIKKLVKYDPSLALPVSHFPLSILPEAPPSISCFQALDYFQTGRAHLLLISNTPGKAGGSIGVITLEGALRPRSFEILSEEIVDETDRYEDNVTKHQASRMATAAVMRGIVERRTRGTSRASERTPLIDAVVDSSVSRSPSSASVGRGVSRKAYGGVN
ncbi:hypothetical protein GGX14DRAFT_460871 [Mycena pura]|uniref:CNNM transmembrane domain-containing protein n=1 Tax=Mycena pura TaxID=153505 RepID=A0AAD6V6X1_9AGAR|nr:hypothetical protein GGX14DRAFT_460871 [Mycena pura]